MNIAIDARMITYTGIGRYIQHLIKNLSSLDKNNIFSVLLDSDSNEMNADNIRKSILKRKINIYSLREQLFLPIEMARMKPDLMHYPSFNMPLVNSRPAVVTIHDLIYYLSPEACPNSAARLYAKFMFNAVSRTAKRIITDSEHTKKDIVEHLGVRPGKITVIYPGVDDFYRPLGGDHPQVRRKYKIEGEYIFYVGNHGTNKNLIRLVQAFSISKKRGSLKLVIAGKIDPRRKELYETPSKLNIDDRVSFIGRVADEDLPALYSMASLFVFPSTYEGFGLPPLEAMACGTPVVSSNASSLPEVIGDAAVSVDPFDVEAMAHGIDKVLSSETFKGELREKGLERARLFNWMDTARQTLEVYKEVLGSGGAHH